MIKTKQKNNYSQLTLRPNNLHERELFWDFRCQDISDLMIYYVIASVCMLFTIIVQYYNDRTTTNLRLLVFDVINTVLYIVVWALRKRCSKVHVYMMVFLFTVT